MEMLDRFKAEQDWQAYEQAYKRSSSNVTWSACDRRGLLASCGHVCFARRRRLISVIGNCLGSAYPRRRKVVHCT